MLTVQEALDQVAAFPESGSNTDFIALLRNLSDQLDATATPGTQMVLYSGVGQLAELRAAGDTGSYSTIGQTDVGAFLNDSDLNDLIADRFASEMVDGRYPPGSLPAQALFSFDADPPSLWADASARFASTASGDVIFVGVNSTIDSVLAALNFPP